MPTVTITDENGKSLFSSEVVGQGFAGLLKTAVSLRGAATLKRRLAAPLADATAEREVDLNVAQAFAIGQSADLTIGAGALTSIAIRHAGDEIFPASDLQTAVTVPNGTVYLCWTLGANLNAGLTGAAGALDFGFNAGTAIRYSYAAPFDVAAGLSVGDAIRQLLSSVVMPATADDLSALPAGAQVSIAGEGKLSFEAQATLSAATNLLATPSLPLVGVSTVAGAASVSVKAGWTMEGDFELRVARTPAGDVRLSFNRRKNRSLTISAKANAGITANVRKSELIGALQSALGGTPEADVLGLVDAGLSDAQIESMQKAIADSIDRSLSVSAQVQLSSLRETESLFAYDLAIARLDNDGKAAVAEALHGRLTALDALASATGRGVTLVTSAKQRLSERKTTWRLNLLGRLNVTKLSDLLAKGSQAFDPISGAFIAADQVTAKRILVVSRPGEVDAGALRKVMLESLMATAAYQASRALGATVSLKAEHMYAEQHGKASRANIEEHYRALVGLRLCDAAERDARLEGVTDFGASTFVIQNAFDSAACDAMFLDATGQPRSQEHYETLARQALVACFAGAADQDHRRLALEADTMWTQVRVMGSAIKNALPSSIANNVVKVAVIEGDVITVMWWAMAMRKSAVALSEMRAFLKGRDAAALVAAADPSFVKEREKLSKSLQSVVATSEARFDDPWDAIALDQAASGLGTLEATVVTSRFSAHYSDAAPGAVPAARTGDTSAAARGIRLRGPGTRDAAAAQPWSQAQLDIFTRHVVNLRKGELSTGGTVQSSKAQVENIFRTFIPEYAAKADAQRRDPHVMFVAHGGLNAEVDALKHVLAQYRFFLMNGVYPVYFVWETGLKETLVDIVGLPARGRLSDAVIERAARTPGKKIWDTMKDSAARAAATTGGSKLVADLAVELWKARGGAIGYHALGHSAGSIFDCYFIPLLAGQTPAGASVVSLSSLHFLAPAVTSALFKKQLIDLVGPGKPITQLAMYTMLEELEVVDSSLGAYGHSLLMLVNRAFEDEVGTPILGLFESLRRDPDLIRYFGIRGTGKVADLVLSQTAATASLRNRSQSNTHGGFDNDPDTMTSVIRRVLDVPDTTAVVPYAEDTVDAVADRRLPLREAVRIGSSASGRGRSPKAPRAKARAQKPKSKSKSKSKKPRS